ncbi:unnamed protein product [Lasius platythorax]|uniref:Uncharacterized protein n=1 Tax=Lasius platythorax TaxID=488582 RepID=A0AAV2P5Y2_9HYME
MTWRDVLLRPEAGTRKNFSAGRGGGYIVRPRRFLARFRENQFLVDARERREFILPNPPASGVFDDSSRRLKNLREINRGGSENVEPRRTLRPAGSTSEAILPAIGERNDKSPSSDQMVIHDAKSRAEWIANCEKPRR